MKYFALLTEIGENLLAQATALGTKLELTHIAVGDGNGQLPIPDPKQTKLVAEKRRGAINTLFIDEKNKNQIVAEQIIPETDGGWWVREIGLFDKSANLIAVANCPETYKPQLSEGSARTQTIRMILIVSHTESVTVKIDPSVVLATREYVDKAIEVRDKKINDIVNKKLDKTDIVQETGNNTDKVMSQKACTDLLAKKISDESLEAGKIYISGSSTDAVLSIGGSTGYDIVANKKTKTLILRNVSTNTTINVPTKSGTLALVSDLTATLYPIGIAIFFAQNKNPNQLFPGTKWQYTGENKTIRLAKADGSDILKTGGADTIKLTEAQLPAHGHTFSATTSSFDYGTKTTSTTGEHAHNYTNKSKSTRTSGDAWSAAAGENVNATTSASGNHAHTVAIGAHNHTVSGTTGKTGSGSEINIINAFVTLMCWYRVS
ncbi:phage tail protein [Arsenophonus sp. aPb]|uniref:phage tail-collar fiber domain-containing protein n=1 Tax=Arsenophonus sp. aPb TaxID=3041619 RepID=UPI0024686AF5|nr:phage tail protein [Arsenophonus sp. aPb]WGL97192.1 phage tail protein [Arsenophonus sp. aPb]